MSWPNGNNKVDHDQAANFPETGNSKEFQRLFFALWPDNDLRLAVQNLKSLTDITDFGRCISIDNIHITLVFLGQIDMPAKSCAECAAEHIHGKSFKLVLDRLGYWSKPQILWLAPSQIPLELTALYDLMKSRLIKCGVTLDERPYKPHLTLARKVKKPPPRIKIEPLTWHVKQYSLMESRQSPGGGVNYQELACWKLE